MELPAICLTHIMSKAYYIIHSERQLLLEGYTIRMHSVRSSGEEWTPPSRSEVSHHIVQELRDSGYGWIQIAMLAFAIFNAVTWILDRLRERERDLPALP